jgi:hypothetical protein
MNIPDDTPRFRELAFPQGHRVAIGPSFRVGGRVDWSDPGRIGGDRFTADTTMLDSYTDCVPVRTGALIPFLTWVHQRWLRSLPNASNERRQAPPERNV